MCTFNTSRLKTSVRFFGAVVPFTFALGLFISLWDFHFDLIQLSGHWFHYLFSAWVFALVLFSFVWFPILLQDGINGVQVASTGLTLIIRSRDRSRCRDTDYEIPWNSIKALRMKPAFPKALTMVDIQLLCVEEGIAVNSFRPPVLGGIRLPVSAPKGGPKNFAFTPREFPSGLLIFPLPWQLQQPELFKAAVLREAPADHPLVQFFREHPDLVQ